jgi:hypothetical protein
MIRYVYRVILNEPSAWYLDRAAYILAATNPAFLTRRSHTRHTRHTRHARQTRSIRDPENGRAHGWSGTFGIPKRVLLPSIISCAPAWMHMDVDQVTQFDLSNNLSTYFRS